MACQICFRAGAAHPFDTLILYTEKNYCVLYSFPKIFYNSNNPLNKNDRKDGKIWE